MLMSTLAEREGGEVPDMKTTLCCVLWSTCSAVSVPFIPLDEVTARAAQGRKHGLLNLKLIGDILPYSSKFSWFKNFVNLSKLALK